ncbi:MAG TPA: glycoside hydrolase family 2 TIM barrel-domain containing protein, partial [Lacipirellulaceae bacterium]|nr:glycoside hydrolase family 2 TIM barrel-domain containing protein [Lacipirellulaceae bacterium]
MTHHLKPLWIAVALAMLAAGDALAWEPAKGPLATRWAKDVSPERVWPEYPRPQMVREDWVNLNGLWNYAIRPASDEKPSEWDGEILVPFAVESALSGVKKGVQPHERLWYRRSFTRPQLDEDERLLLHFGAVDWKCTVWVNGEQVGEHTGGYDPFTFDITDALQDGENKIVVAVSDPTDTGNQPRGKQVLAPRGIMYTAVTGIWQTVWLERVPERHIESLRIVPDIDRGVVTVKVSTTADEREVVRIKALRDGGAAGEAQGAAGAAIEVAIPNAVLWSPDEPKLYDLVVELVDGGQTVDAVTSYFGMRKIEVKKDDEGINRLWLNNKVVFQYGPLDQGWWPDGLYTPASDEAMKFDIEMTKRLGMNMARKHVKYECDRWYYWCDRLGLLVWQDMPSGNVGRRAESRANFRRELQAMIDALHNHPSIVMWVPFNEGWGQHETPEVVAWVKEYDPSRPVNEASGW